MAFSTQARISPGPVSYTHLDVYKRQALNDLFQLFADMGKPISPEKKFKELVGHTPLQVVCGAILGIAVGCALMQI